MPVFLFHTQRTIEIVADSEEEASKQVQAELHRDETILSMDDPVEEEPKLVW